MVDWLAIWGGAATLGLVFKPILEDFAKDIVKDVAKDYVKACFGNVFSSLTKEPLQRALGKAFKELLQLIQDELLDSGVREEDLAQWVQIVKSFSRSHGVQQAMLAAFTEPSSSVDPALLARGWQENSHPPPIPVRFSWQRVAGRFSRAVRNLRESDIELRQILAVQAQLQTADATRQFAGLVPAFDIEGYRKALLERYAKLHFDKLHTTGALYSGVALWSVFVPQKVRESGEYHPLLEVPKEHLQRIQEKGHLNDDPAQAIDEILEERRRAYLDQSPRPVLEIAGDDRIQRIVILGDPGSGKSCLLQFLALKWARIEDPNQFLNAAVPLIIELREYNDWECPSGKSFVRYLNDASTWYRLNQFDLDEKLRTRGAVIILLDGLDEVFNAVRREQVVNDIHRLSNDYPDTKIIVTSRAIGYKPYRLADAEFRHFMLQDLDDEQIANFLQRWHELTFDDSRDAQLKKERLTTAVQDCNAIRELAGNPLLLTLMAILNRHHELPRDRVHLYEDASRKLLDDWDTEHALESHPRLKGVIGYPEKRDILQDVAYAMQATSSSLAGNIIGGEQLERVLQDYLRDRMAISQPQAVSRDLVNQLRERNFILCYVGAESYAFIHRTFLEYFCALALVRQFQQKLTLDFLKNEVFGEHWQDESWHELLCLVAGIVAETSVEQAAEIVEFLLTQRDPDLVGRNLLLAARCYNQIRNSSSLGTLRQAIQSALEPMLAFDFPFYYGDDRHEPELAGRRIRLRGEAVESLSKLVPAPFEWLKERATKDLNWEVRSAALIELARGWRSQSDTSALLKERAENDDDWGTRATAFSELVSGLVNGWNGDSVTMRWLKERAEDEDFDWPKSLMVRDLARVSAGQAGMAAWLRHLVKEMREDPLYLNTVMVVLRELARGWKDDSGTLTLLKEVAGKDEGWIRTVALSELARWWKDDPATLALVKECARDDKDHLMMAEAIKLLANGWRHDPETLMLLRERAASDDHWTVRIAALNELAHRWKRNHEIFVSLKDLATHEKETQARARAIRELAHRYKENPGTLEFLKQRAESDLQVFVRQQALVEVARGWSGDHRTWSWLKDRIMEVAQLRPTALRELARGWTNDPQTLALVKDRAANDRSAEMRILAARELARGWRDDHDTLTLLKKAAMEQDWNARDAVRDLARGWRDDPDTFLIVKEFSVRERFSPFNTVDELVRGWKDNPATFVMLRELVATGNYSGVTQIDENVPPDEWVAHFRSQWLSLLARGWRDEPETLPFLQERAAEAEHWSVQISALSELSRGWANVPEVLALLKDRAANGKHPAARVAALVELARKCNEDEDTLPLLKRAVEDEDKDVRQVAMKWLKRRWKNDPEVQRFLDGVALQ